MEEQQNLYQKLACIQQKLKAPKNQFNSFGNYKYRSCEDILNAVKPLLGDLTLILNDELVYIGNRYYVKATATLSNSNGLLSVDAWAREEETKKGMDAAQITGAVSSYARKYALNGLFLIDDSQDPDTQDNTHKVEPKVEKKPAQKEAPPDKVKVAIQYIENQGITHDEAVQMMGEPITENNLPKLKKVFKAWQANQAKKVDPEPPQEATDTVACPDKAGELVPIPLCNTTCPNREGCPAFE